MEGGLLSKAMQMEKKADEDVKNLQDVNTALGNIKKLIDQTETNDSAKLNEIKKMIGG